MALLPEAVAVDRPLKLGSTLTGQQTDEYYYTLKLDFQPESLHQAQEADLLLFQENQLKLIPQIPEGDCPFHFEGSLEHLQPRPGGDLDCVAYFDGTEWTLQLVTGHLRAKHRPGVPIVPGYNCDAPEEPAGQQHAPAPQQQPQSSSKQQLRGGGHGASSSSAAAAAWTAPDVDPDLDSALDELLFSVGDKPTISSHAQQPQKGQPPTGTETHPGRQQHTQHTMQRQTQPPQQQPQQQQQQQQPQQQRQPPVVQQQQAAPPQQQAQQQVRQSLPMQQQPSAQPQQMQPQAQPLHAVPAAAAEDEDESGDDDDIWNTFNAAAAAAPAPKLAVPPSSLHQQPQRPGVGGVQQQHIASQPAPAAQAAAAPAAARPAGPVVAQAAAAAPVPAVSAGSRGAVSVLGGEEEEEEDGAGQHCSEDESDGVGVEYF